MAHRADESWFDAKREWSKIKDAILQGYLPPYLAKVAHLRRPVVIVDGFAGCGMFKDGAIGSPLIICNAIANVADKTLEAAGSMGAIFVEQHPGHAEKLAANVAHYRFARVWQAELVKVVEKIVISSSGSTVFWYLDPYTHTPVSWDMVEIVMEGIRRGQSVELVLNFNAATFVRDALATAKQKDDASRLDCLMGGNWWQSVVFAPAMEYREKVEAVAEGYARNLRGLIPEVQLFPVRARWGQVPKYYLIFASRHPDALLLLNNAVAEQRAEIAEREFPVGDSLFELAPVELRPDLEGLRQAILESCEAPMRRRALVVAVVRHRFGLYKEKEIRHAIQRLCESHKLSFSSKTARLNDEAVICRSFSHPPRDP